MADDEPTVDDILALALEELELERQDVIFRLTQLDDAIDRVEKARSILAGNPLHHDTEPLAIGPAPDPDPEPDPESESKLGPYPVSAEGFAQLAVDQADPEPVDVDQPDAAGDPDSGDDPTGPEPSERHETRNKPKLPKPMLPGPEPATVDRGRRSSARGPRNRAELLARAEKVAAALRARGGSATIVELRDDIGESGHQPVLGALRFLEAEGRVRKGDGEWLATTRADAPPAAPAETRPSVPPPVPAMMNPAPDGEVLAHHLNRDKLTELVETYGPIGVPQIVERLPWAVSSALPSHLPVFQMLAELADAGLVRKVRGGRWESAG